MSSRGVWDRMINLEPHLKPESMLKLEESRRIEERFLNFVLYFQNCSNVAENVDRIVTVCTTGWKGEKYWSMEKCSDVLPPK